MIGIAPVAAVLLQGTSLFAQEPAPVYPPPPVVEEPRERLYGDQGSSHFGGGLGFGTSSGGGTEYVVGAEYGYFVLDGVAPGIEASVSGGSNVLTTTTVLGDLRLVPVRLSSLSVFVVGRAGRVFISDHPSLWGVGGSVGLIYFIGGPVGLVVSYDYLKLLPDADCQDLANSCDIQGLSLGAVFRF